MNKRDNFIGRMNKKGQLGEQLVIVYRIVIIILIGITIALVAGLFMRYHFNVTSQEGYILQKNVIECLFPGGFVNQGNFLPSLDFSEQGKNSNGELFKFCNINPKSHDATKIYVKIEVNVAKTGSQIVQRNISDGDSGIMDSCRLYASTFGDRFSLKTKQSYPSCSIYSSDIGPPIEELFSSNKKSKERVIENWPNVYKLFFNESGKMYPALVKVYWGVAE